jgi:serine/threonine-protein kinase
MKFNLSLLGFCFAALLTACGGGDPYDAGAHKTKYVAQASTFVGNGNYGSDDGTGSAVTFGNPTAVALSSNGDLYVGDNKLIRKVTPAGEVSTYASIPSGAINGIAIDADGNIFVSSFNDEIFKIAASDPSLATVFAGSSIPATFRNPMGMAIDQSGNLYVADRDNHAIRKISPIGIVTTVAGTGVAGHADGSTGTATFNHPAGVTVDASGNLYVADSDNELIRKISTASGVVTTVAGSALISGNDDGIGAAARFDTPQGLTMDKDGNIIVADTGNHSIRKVTPLGVVTTLAGYGSSGLKNAIGVNAKFYAPMGIAVGHDGTFYIADNGNRMIRLLKMIWI